jgi:hypothetical protein
MSFSAVGHLIGVEKRRSGQVEKLWFCGALLRPNRPPVTGTKSASLADAIG